jgi:hypothetical protein
MAIKRKSELRTVTIILNDGALSSIQGETFDWIEDDGVVVPGTQSTTLAVLEPDSKEYKTLGKILGDAALAGIVEKDSALQEAYAERDTLRVKHQHADELQIKLTNTEARLEKLKTKLAAVTDVSDEA